MSYSITVGQDECPISKVLSTIKSSNSLGILHEKWSQVARGLSTPNERVKKIRDDLILNKINLQDAIHDILEDWVGRSGNAATLHKLVGVLEITDGLKSCAESLQRAFLIDPSNKIKKYCRLPSGLKEFLNCSSKFVIIRTLSSNITCEKIRENVKMECKFHEWRDFIKFLSSAHGFDPTALHIVKDCNIKGVNHVLSKLPEKYFTKLVFLIENEEEEIRVDNTSSWKHKMEIHVDSLEWNDLSLDNQIRTMEQLEKKFKIKVEEEKLDKVLDKNIFVDLLMGNEVKPFIPTVPQQLSYYVKRTILTRNILSKKLFEDDSQDIFIFAEMNWNELSGLVKGRVTDSSSNQIRKGEVTIRRLILDQPTHFDKICGISSHPTHLIRRESDGRLKWAQSNGQMNSVLRNVDFNSQDELDEEEFLKGLPSNTNQPVILSDTPGMGKSVLLAQIGNRFMKLSPDKCVFFFVMTEFIKHIKVAGLYDMKTGVETALQTATCKDEFGKTVLASKLKLVGTISIELLLDGFDEVDPTDLELAYDILAFLKHSFRSIRLWVTSRPHLLEELEVRLNVLGYNLKPFGEENQVQFLSSYWSVDKTLNVKKLKQFAMGCISALKSCMNTRAHDIAGIPLQCLLLAEIYEDEAIDQAEWVDSAPTPQKPFKSIANLYARLIEKKVQKYKSSYGGTKLSEADIMDTHIWMSLELLFSEHSEKLPALFGHCLSIDQARLGEMLKVGVLESVPGSVDGPRFIHRTFAEYFVAWFFINKTSAWTEELNDWFFEIVLTCGRFQFGLKHNIVTPSYKFLHPVICYFLNSLIPSNPVLPNSFKFRNKQLQLAHACGNGDYFRLFKFFYEMDEFKTQVNSIFDNNFILLTTHSSGLELIELAFDNYEQRRRLELDQQREVLRVAVRRGDFAVVEFLLKEKKLLEVVEYTRLLLHECVANSRNKSEEKIQHKIQICRRLASINPSLLEDRDGYGRTPLLGDDVHVKIKIELMNGLGASIFAQNEDHNTVAHLDVIRKLSSKDYHTLVTSIPDEALKKLVHARGSYGHTPLTRLVEQIDPLPETLERFRKMEADFNDIDQQGYSTLAVAILNGRNASTIRKLVDCGARVVWKKGWRRKTFLHYAAEYGNPDAVRVLVEWMDVNIKDWTWSTPLDYAIWSETKSGKRFETGVALHQLGGTFQDMEDHTLLHEAVSKMNLDSIRLLVHLKVDVNAVDKLGNTPLHLAMSYKEPYGGYNNFNIAKLLLDNQANPNMVNRNGETPFHLALKTNPMLDLQTFKLLKYRTLWTPSLATLALKFAIVDAKNLGDDEFYGILRECEENGADCNYIDKDGNSLLHIAAERGSLEGVHYLVLNKANIHLMNNLQETALHKAVNGEDITVGLKIIKYLIDNDSVYTKDHTNSTFLHRLISKFSNPSHFHSMAEYLIGKGQSKLFDAPGGKDGTTSLQLAVWNLPLQPDDKTLALLYSSGVNFNSVDTNGDSVLSYAVMRKRSREFLNKLIEFGADHKHFNKRRRSLLHTAASDGTLEALQCILELGGLEVNEKDTEGNTPLHFSVVSKSFSLEKTSLLVEMGADIEMRNHAAVTPLKLALIAMNGKNETEKLEWIDLLTRSQKPINEEEEYWSKSNAGSEEHSDSEADDDIEITHL